MKIGILTLPLGLNYGGIMQAWALQSILKQLGHDSEIIDIQKRKNGSAVIICKRIISWVMCVVRKYILHQNQYKICNPFANHYSPTRPEFIDKDFVKIINRTGVILGSKKLRGIVKKNAYEAFIVGSDQVWRQDYSPNIKAYFLDFLDIKDNRKKIAYAASFGNSNAIEKSKLGECALLLRRFDAVSVREVSGLDFVKTKLDYYNAVVVVDPTLLFGQEDYNDLMRRVSQTGQCNHPTRYIGSYILDLTKDILEISDCVKNLYGIPLWGYNLGENEDRNMTVTEWVSIFANAEFVITDSFHGCVFSIIYRKPFVVIVNIDRGEDRFKSLLEPLGLLDRMVHDKKEFDSKMDVLTCPIDYENVYRLLIPWREESICFLRKSLNTN